MKCMHKLVNHILKNLKHKKIMNMDMVVPKKKILKMYTIIKSSILHVSRRMSCLNQRNRRQRRRKERKGLTHSSSFIFWPIHYYLINKTKLNSLFYKRRKLWSLQTNQSFFFFSFSYNVVDKNGCEQGSGGRWSKPAPSHRQELC